MQQTMDSKNFMIGVLSTTAVILFVGLVVIQTRPQPARADGMAVIRGDYSITVGALTRNDEDLLYIIDSVAQRLNTYRFDSRRKQIELVQSSSISDDGSGPGAKKPRRRGRGP